MSSKRQNTNGPDQIIPCENISTTNVNNVVKLRLSEKEKYKPISIPSALIKTAELYPTRSALCHKENELWKIRTFKEYLDEVQTCAKAFLKLGLERHNSVCILGYNSPQWVISNTAAIFAGGIATGIHMTNSSEECFNILNTSKANIIVLEDEIQLSKIRSIKSRLPNLKAIIQYTGVPKDADVLSWQDLLKIGEKQSDDQLNKTLKSIAINECCTLIYTSGAEGNPKGVMLNHDNLIWSAEITADAINIEDSDEKILSYLPLSHTTGQILDIYIPICRGSSVLFADNFAIEEELIDTLREVQPTKFVGIPKIWEKIYNFVDGDIQNAFVIRSVIFGIARKYGLQHHTALTNGDKPNFWSYYLYTYVFEKMKFKIGLINSSIALTTAAPLLPRIKELFTSMDMPILEVYGCSESTTMVTCNFSSPTNYETVGRKINPEIEVKLHDLGKKGKEMCIKGRNVFMGYFNDIENTNLRLDKEGWFHTGDLAKVDNSGNYTIIGRIKDMITCDGEDVAPILIEERVKNELPQISNAFLVGDKKKYLSVLLTLKTEEDGFGKPTDKLLPSVQKWLKSLGCESKTVSEVLKDGPNAKLMEVLQAGIERVNLLATSNAQKIKKIAILPADFSITTGELGPTLKIKRKVVQEKYQDMINKLYL